MDISGLFLMYVAVRRGVCGGSGGKFSAASPHDKDDVDVAEGHEQSWNYEDIRREKGEVKLALPPRRVSTTGALVLDHALGVDANGHL